MELPMRSDERSYCEVGPLTMTYTAFAGRKPVLAVERRHAVEIAFADQYAAWFRAFVARDDSAPFQHVDQPPGPRVAHAQPPLDQGDGRRLGLDDDLDRLVEQRILVGIEFLVVRV